MADTKISALTAASAAALANEIGINEAGTSKKLTLEQIQTLLGVRKAEVVGSAHSNSTTTGTEVTDLSLTLVAGTYRFDYYLICRSTVATTGIHFAINYTGTATKITYNCIYQDTGALSGTADDVGFGSSGAVQSGSISKTEGTTAATVGSYGFGATGSDTLIRISGVIVVSDGGDLELWHASENANATTVEVGSNLVLTRIS